MSHSLDDLAIFSRVGELKNLTKVAEEMHVPKSTISRAMTRLETRLGARLIHRTTRALELTETGRSFHARVTPHVVALGNAREALRDTLDETCGVVRLTAAPDMGYGILSTMLPAFMIRYPRIQIDLDLSGRIVDLVKEHFDMALRATRKIDNPDLVVKRIAATQGRLYASPKYLARTGEPRSLEDLKKHSFVIMRGLHDEPSPFGVSLRLSSGDQESRVEVKGTLASNNFAFIRAAVKQGAGIGLLPELVADQDLIDGSLQPVLASYHAPLGALHLVHPIMRPIPKKVAVLKEFILQWFQANARF